MQDPVKEAFTPSSQASDTEASSATKNENDVDEMFVPEGGKDAWMTVIGSWFVLFGSFGYLYAFGVYEDFYTRLYLTNHSPSEIAWIGSFQLMMPFALGIVSGKLFDEGHFHIVQIVGGLLFTFSLFMLSLAKPLQYYQIFLSQGLGMGIGLGLTFVPCVGIMSHHFKKRRGLATGVALSGSSIGSIIFPIMLNHLIPSIGFPKAVRATAYLVLGTLFIGNCLMRTRLPPRKKRRVQIPPPDIKGFLKDPPYMFAVFGALIASLGFYFPVIYLQLYSVLHSVDGNLAFYSLAILNGGSAVGRVLGNYMADIYGPFNIQVPCTVAVGVLIWAVLGINSSGALIVVSLLYGIFSGAWLALAMACFSSLSSGPEDLGARTGLGLALSSVGSLVAAPIQGQLLTSHFTWIRPVAFSASVLLGSSVCFAVTRILQSRKFSSQRV